MRNRPATRALLGASLAALLLAAAACAGDDAASSTTAATQPPSTDPPDTTAVPTTAAATTAAPDTTAVPTTAAATTAAPDTTAPDTTAPDTTLPEDDPVTAALRADVEALASDEMAGRDNQTPGSELAQSWIIEQLGQFAQPAVDVGGVEASYLQDFALGRNIVGVIPGSDLSGEYVLVGAHYDHLGSDCEPSSPDDDICNGATDNATGTAAALAIGRAIADSQPRRSVVIALWDAEEDGLLGSQAYISDPVVPLDRTVAYVNYDMQGVSMLPSLSEFTVMVGAETGGPALQQAAGRATTASTLRTMPLSLLFGQGRSDHANFAAAGVPSVFFTDSTPPCYHTVDDEIAIVEYPKLVQQLATGVALVTDLAGTDDVPTFDPDAPVATYDDAVALLEIVEAARPDYDTFPPAAVEQIETLVMDLNAIVDAGPGAFDDAAVATLLAGAAFVVQQLESATCLPPAMG